MDVFPELVLELKMMEARPAENCLWGGRGEKAEHPSAMCPALPALPAALQEARGWCSCFLLKSPVRRAQKREWMRNSLDTAWLHMRGNTNQIKSGLIAVLLGLCAKRNVLCPLIPTAHKGRTEFHLPLPSVGDEKHLGKQTWRGLTHGAHALPRHFSGLREIQMLL